MTTEELNIPIVTCGSCGDLVPDAPGHNAFYGMLPSPADEGYGMCNECLTMTEVMVARLATETEPRIEGFIP